MNPPRTLAELEAEITRRADEEEDLDTNTVVNVRSIRGGSVAIDTEPEAQPAPAGFRYSQGQAAEDGVSDVLIGISLVAGFCVAVGIVIGVAGTLTILRIWGA